MIKNVALSIDTHARNAVESLVYRNPAIDEAFKFIGSIYLLLGGVQPQPPTRSEEVNAFLRGGSDACGWVLQRLRAAIRLSIFGSTERLDSIRVEVRWYKKRSTEHFAEMIVLFGKREVESISRTES